MANIISIQITAASKPDAERIARALVQERLAACVNIVPGVKSIYHWQGKLEESDEFMLLAKTRAELFEPLRKFVKSLHSYECPCIVATPVVAGHQPYLDWVAQETQK